MARPSILQKQTEYVHDRPQPPETLTDEQREIWIDLFEKVTPEWIAPESFPLAEMYCQHVARSRHLNDLLAQHEASRLNTKSPIPDLAPLEADASTFNLADWFKLHDKLLKALDRENRAASSLATRLRITTQALRTADNAASGRSGTAQHAWEDDDDYVDEGEAV